MRNGQEFVCFLCGLPHGSFLTTSSEQPCSNHFSQASKPAGSQHANQSAPVSEAVPDQSRPASVLDLLLKAGETTAVSGQASWAEQVAAWVEEAEETVYAYAHLVFPSVPTALEGQQCGRRAEGYGSAGGKWSSRLLVVGGTLPVVTEALGAGGVGSEALTAPSTVQ